MFFVFVFRETDEENQAICALLLREVSEVNEVKTNPLCTERRIKG